VLFIKGHVLQEDERALAVVGSRRASAYGTAVCERLVSQLVKSGFCIVSGMARGIDTVAHWSALENGGRTVGVLGTGADVVYPRSNEALFAHVPEQGFLVSEFLPGTEARPENFPRRNRIISGLACGVLVVEASERSGTMITVRLALEQGREIFSVPGDIRSALSRGTHGLIQKGAKLVGCVEDILEEFPYLFAPNKDGFMPSAIETVHGGGGGNNGSALAMQAEASPPGEQEEVRALLQLLDDAGTGLDSLVRRTGWRLEKLSLLLTELELSGRVKRVPGNRYARFE
jgi:DNA processing protein